MSYVVLDLEWNQAMSSKASVFNKLPIRLRGEIIQIGAVRLNDDMTPGEEFQVDVRPVYFRRMHNKVKKLTGFDKERLENGIGFPEAMAQLRAFCGDGCTFLTWGYDDKGILEQNIIIHNLDWDWIDKWINLQLIYSIQTEGDRNQKSLASAMEHFQIPQTRTAHDALGDAYNTAVVCSHLDMETGLAQYDDTTRALPVRMSGAGPGQQGAEPLEHSAFSGFHDRMEPFDDPAVTHLPCPQCGGETSHTKWVSQGDRRYMALYECPKHGHYLMRLKLRQSEDGTWGVNRILYKADEKMEQYFTAKSTTRRRLRRRRKKKS